MMINTHTSQRTKTYLFIYGILVLIGLVYFHLYLRQYVFDDSFIHFRIARNFVEHGQPYYNLGQAIKVSTSTGWMLYTAAVYAISKFIGFADFTLLINISNLICSLVGMCFFSLVLWKVNPERMKIWYLPLWQIPYLVIIFPSSVGLMETPMAMMLLSLGIWTTMHKKSFGYLLLGVMVFFRAELVLFTILVIFVTFFIDRRQWISVPFVVIGTLPFLVFDLVFYKSILPQSLSAKSIIYQGTWFTTLIDLLFHSFPLIRTAYNPILLMVGSTLGALVVLVGISRLINIFTHSLDWGDVLFWGGCGIAAVYVYKAIFLFDWYIPLYAIPILAGIFQFGFKQSLPRNRITGVGYVFFFLFCLFAILETSPFSSSGLKNYYLFVSGARVRQYQAIGSILEQVFPDESLMASEIGGLGDGYSGLILDAAGLATPSALVFQDPEQFTGGTNGNITLAYVREAHPDLIVSYDSFALNLINGELDDEYSVFTLSAYLPDDRVVSADEALWGNLYIRIFVRNDHSRREMDQLVQLIKTID